MMPAMAERPTAVVELIRMKIVKAEAAALVDLYRSVIPALQLATSVTAAKVSLILAMGLLPFSACRHSSRNHLASNCLEQSAHAVSFGLCLSLYSSATPTGALATQHQSSLKLASSSQR